MLLECQNCGAPLDTDGKSDSVQCRYCGKTSEVKRARTVAQETPADWVPPPSWTRPPDFQPMQELVQAGVGAAKRAVVRAITIALLAMVVAFGFIGWQVFQSATGGVAALNQAANVDGVIQQAMGAIGAAAASATQAAALAAGNAGVARAPVVCDGNESVTLTGQTLALPDGSPVVATGNCTLKLVACTITGDVPLTARGNAHVTIEGGTLTGTGPAVLLSTNASLEASNVVLVGEATISASGNARAVVRASTVSGRSIAVRATGLATVELPGTTVTGQVVGKRRTPR